MFYEKSFVTFVFFVVRELPPVGSDAGFCYVIEKK